MIKDEEKLWGIDIEKAFKYGKRYKIYSTLVYIIDVLIMIFGVHYMMISHCIFGTYLKFMLICTIVGSFLLSFNVHEDLLSVYKFVKKFSKCIVKKKTIKSSAVDVYKCVYRAYRSKLKKDDALENYIQVIYDSCAHDIFYSKKIGKFLTSLKSNADNADSYEVSYITKGHNNYLVSIRRISTDGSYSEE